MNFQKIKKDLQSVYDDLAKDWGSRSTDSWGLEYLNKFAELAKSQGAVKVLDMGCGSGIQSKLLSENNFQMTGIDLSPLMIKEAKKRLPEANFIVGDITQMPFKVNSFDAVLAKDCIFHMPKDLVPGVLNSVYKLLWGKGYFYLSVKKGEGEKEKEQIKYGKKIRRFIAYFKEKEITNLIKKSGFEIIQCDAWKRIESSDTVWIEIIAKKN